MPGGLASSLAITLDTLQTANAFSRQRGKREAFEVRTFEVTRTTTCRFREGDVVIVPGLGTTTQAELVACLAGPVGQRAVKLVRAARAAGAIVVASCASTFILAEAGLLKGRRATTTWWLAPVFRQRYPDVELVTEQIVVADWPVATRGGGDGADGSHAGGDREVRRNPDLAGLRALPPARSSQFAGTLHGHNVSRRSGWTDRARESWLRKNIDRKVSMDDLAAAAGLSPRTFARRLKAVCDLSPVRFAQRIRAEVAAMLRQTTSLSVDEISRRVGYAEPSTLRRLLRRDARPM